MQLRFYAVPVALLAAALSCAPSAVAETSADATPGQAPSVVARSVVVAPSHIDPAFRAIAAGYVEFIRQQLARVGLEVVGGAQTRGAMELPAQSDTTARTTGAELARARRTGAGAALLVDLRSGRGVVEIDLRAYSLDAQGAPGAEPPLVGGALGVGTLSTLSATTNPVLLQVLPALDPELRLQPPSEGLPGADQLAAASRALALSDAGALRDAWRELEGLDSPFLSALRSQINAAAKRPGVSMTEQARLLIAQGRVAAGWRLVFDRAQQALSAGTADAPLLVAAGEAQLAQGNARGAARYFEKSVALAPTSAAASMGLARAYKASHRIKDAREEYERAAELAPTQIGPLEELASLPSSSPSEEAHYLFEAGRRSSGQLRSAEARLNLQRAVRLDPSLAPLAADTSADLHARLGEHPESLADYREAIRLGAPTPARLRGVGDAQHALRDVDGAEASYLEVLKLDHNDVDALKNLGEIYVEEGDPEMAVVRLERAHALAPARADLERSLATALHGRGGAGDLGRAVELHEAAALRAEPTATDLQELAALQSDMGDSGQAIVTLERSLLRRQLSMYGRHALADAYRARGDAQSAEAILSVVRLVSGEAAASGESQSAAEADRFDALLQSFVTPASYGQTVVFVGLEAPKHWRDRLVDWLHPRAPDFQAIENGIVEAINRSHRLAGVPVGALEVIGASRAALFDFDSELSRSTDLITFTNLSMGSDAIFLGRLLRPLGSLGAVPACGSEPYYVLELRKLTGQNDEQVSVLANRACVAASVENGYSIWNTKASIGWVLLLLLILRPAIRGWGRVRVIVRAPEHGRALFSVSISRRPKKFKEDKKDSAAPAWRFEKRLESTHGARRLKGNVMSFSVVPARRKPYYVTVRGPLLDLSTDKLIGEFLEEKTVVVRPWRTNEIKFDMRTETTAITVKPQLAGASDLQARVALRGKPQSVRFTSGGEAYLYVPVGKHVIVVGAADRVVEFPIDVQSPAPISLEIDMNDLDTQLFSGCPEAVAPYVEGDYAAALEALAAIGDTVAVERVRALHLRTQGDAEGAAQVLESAGMHAASVELRVDESAKGRAEAAPAELLEKAGEYRKAAEAFERAGNQLAAARNFEQAYDYQRAAECYGEVGDTEKVLCMLEALGDVYEAGRTAAEAGQVDRAIHNLQQVDSRHGFYSEACRMLAELLGQRGEIDLAVSKFGEALDIRGDSAPLEMQQSYAELLEQAERQQEALTVYEGIRSRDVHFGDVASRIEVLKKQISTVATHANSSDSAPTIVTATGPKATIGDADSRYEILDELGRGGMGVVFRARDRNLGRVVALKVLPESLRQHPQAVKLFLREARAAAALNHQNIVTLFDAGQEGDTYFLTMECLEGAGLETVLASKGALPTKAVATVGLQVAAGLDYAQRAKIVHRDIKPSNLFLTRDRTVKIMDFGLAKMVEEVRRGSTVIGGTPNFMAPEQAQGGDVDHRTDLYALGGTLFELLTGTVPFESGDVVYHHVHTPPPDARERNVDVPAPMAELLLELMAKQPDDRVQSARELAERLQAILKSA